jgi:ribosomal protein S27E
MIDLEVMCPICRSVIAGPTENELSLRLQRHMVEEHELTGACDMGSPSPGIARVCRPSSSGKAADRPYAERIGSEGDRKGGPAVPGEDVAQSVRCPVCGETLLGHDLNDLTFYLEKHLREAHRLKRSRRTSGGR